MDSRPIGDVLEKARLAPPARGGPDREREKEREVKGPCSQSFQPDPRIFPPRESYREAAAGPIRWTEHLGYFFVLLSA